MALAQHPNGQELSPRLQAQRERDRQAMRRLVRDRGFEHAIESLASVVAVEVSPDVGADVDDRMAKVSAVTEAAVLNAMVWVARSQGWTT